TYEEQDEVQRMSQWHEFATPIYRAAQEQAETTFGAAWQRTVQSAVKAEKLEPEAAQRLWKAPDPIREAIILGREQERKAQKEKAAKAASTRPAAPTHRPAPSSPSRVTPMNHGTSRTGDPW